MAVRQDHRHEATKHSPNSFCSRLVSSDCWMRNFPELRPGRASRTVDQLAEYSLDDQSRRYVSRCNYKAKGTDLGTYTVSGDTLTVQETRQSGKVPKNCKGPGMYKFSRPDANTLAFVLVNDACKPRIQNVTQPWHRQ